MRVRVRAASPFKRIQELLHSIRYFNRRCCQRQQRRHKDKVNETEGDKNPLYKSALIHFKPAKLKMTDPSCVMKMCNKR